MIVYHAYPKTARERLVFVAKPDSGPWWLFDTVPPLQDPTPAMAQAKRAGLLVEVITTDDEPARVRATLQARSAAFHAAGLGPDRSEPTYRPLPPSTAPRREGEIVLKLRDGVVPPFSRRTARRNELRKLRREQAACPATPGVNPPENLPSEPVPLASTS